VTANARGDEHRILIDATPLQSEHRLRGVGAYLRNLIRTIEHEGEARPWYVASTVGRELVRDLLPPERTVFVPRPHAPAQVYWAYNELALRAALRRARPAAFLATDFNGLVRNPYGTTVAVLHDLTALKLLRASEAPRPTDLSTRLSDLRWRVYERKLRRADRIIAISHSAKRDAVALLGIPEERIAVVHLAVDHERFKPSRGVGPFAGSPPYLLHLGARNENKNQARIVEAFARIAPEHPKLELWFAGPWREGDLAWLAHENERWGLGGRAKHIGYVPDDDLPSLYGNAAVFVFPSLEEGFGLPVLEAMACGAPVITSDRSALVEVAADAALLVDPLQIAVLTEAMCNMLGRRNHRDELEVRGFAHAQRLTWSRTTRGTLATLGASA
jgi:glycosyltransferase involved in cell wall biosynthesis